MSLSSYSAAVKAGARIAGVTTGPVRAPLLELEADELSELATVIEYATAAQLR